MKHTFMNNHVHSPAFIKSGKSIAADKTDGNDKEIQNGHTAPNRQISGFRPARIAEIGSLLVMIAGALYLISKAVTPQVITAVSVIIGFFVMRFIVRTILRVAFTLLSFLFLLFVLAVILFGVF